MAVQSIDDAGNITWACLHQPEEADRPCGTQHAHHISHEHIQWVGEPNQHEKQHSVSLPPCSGCGARTFLKVSFTEKELKAPNMWLPWNSWWEERLTALKKLLDITPEEASDRDVLASQIQQLQAQKEAGGVHTGSHAMAMRHQELARQLKASGKHPQIGEEEQ